MLPFVGGGYGGFSSSTPSQQAYGRPRQTGGGCGGSPFPAQSEQGYRGQRRIEGGHGGPAFSTQSQQGQSRQLQIHGPELSPRARMGPKQEGQAFGPGDREGQRMDHGNSQPANSLQLNQPFAVQQARGILSHYQIAPADPVIPSTSLLSNASRHPTLGDIHLTTPSYHHEPKPEAYMRERDFALAIATDYITAWSKFTQAGIAHYLRAIEINAPDAAAIKSQWIPEKRKYLEQMLPRQFEQMKRQTREGDELQVRQLVDWIRKEKIWERVYFEAVGALDDYRHLLPWMQGASSVPTLGRVSGIEPWEEDGRTGRVWELGVGGSAMS